MNNTNHSFSRDEYEIPERCVLSTGQMFEGYRIMKHLGEGTFGLVYKAEKNGEFYAIKVLKLWEVGDDKVRTNLNERFVLEYETAQIDSPYLVRSLGYGKHKGNPYIVMEFCENGDLEHKIPVSEQELDKLAFEVLSGLRDLHRNGKVHRDLKPQNVLLDNFNTAKITDFGITGHAGLQKRLTEVNWMGKPRQMFGTYAYMPPEQLKPKDKYVTMLPTADIFAFGVMSFELITGTLPFGSLENDAKLVDYLRNAATGNIVGFNRSNLSKKWKQIIEYSLHPDYKKRAQNVEQVFEMLGYDILQSRQTNKWRVGTSPSLKIMQGEDYGKEFLLSDREIYSLGREDDETKNDIAIKETMSSHISRRHATIEKHGVEWFIRDGQWDVNKRKWLNSLNGTYVGSQEVSSNGILLKDNDVLTLGGTTLRVMVELRVDSSGDSRII